ncbi:adenosine kinase-like [Myzus persicae]|uniref:adenosine kinase-like n=1 Tax=Myzus persicae TaxID=13164 RepID=UPI000B934600|nr:adenosine kinase-like [Myzus persicae]
MSTDIEYNSPCQKLAENVVHRRTIVKPGMIVGFGQPLLDMTVVGDEKLLKKYDLKSNDAVLACEKNLGIYEELEKDPTVQYTAGGSGQNSMRFAQWVLGEPNSVTFFGAVGNDRYSEILKRVATQDGLDVKYQYHSDKPTGTCAVIVTNNGKDRSLCANLCASRNFSDDHLEVPENKKIVENAKVYLVTGFFSVSNPSTVEKIGKIADKRNCPLLFNMSAPYIYELYLDSVMSIFPYINIIFGNAEEAKAFSLANNWETTDIEMIARKMSTFNVGKEGYRLVIFTQDDKPVIVALRGLVSKFEVPEIPEQDIVDTNGAGDAFIGAFIAKYVLGYPLKSCIHSAINGATYIIKQHGMTRGDNLVLDV